MAQAGRLLVVASKQHPYHEMRYSKVESFVFSSRSHMALLVPGDLLQELFLALCIVNVSCGGWLDSCIFRPGLLVVH